MGRGRPGAQDRDDLVGGVVPVQVEVWPAGNDVRVERVAEPVGGEEVQASIAHEGGRRRHRVEDALHAGADLLPLRPVASGRARWL
jgi:hypothetical protein